VRDGERLPILRPGLAHGAESARQIDRLGPGRKLAFDGLVGFGGVGEHLEARPRAGHVVGQREDNAAGIGVVGHLVAGTVAECPPDFRRSGGVGRQVIGAGPVLAIVQRGLRGVEPGTHEHQLPGGLHLLPL